MANKIPEEIFYIYNIIYFFSFTKDSNAAVATKNIYSNILDVCKKKKNRGQISKFKSGNFDLSDSLNRSRRQF